MSIEILWEKNKILVNLEQDLQASFLKALPNAQFNLQRQLWVISTKERTKLLLWVDDFARQRSEIANHKINQITKGVRDV